jgi:peptidoglycan hydrolase CwlO-like protein
MENNQVQIEKLKSEINENNIDLKQIYQSVGERISVPGVYSGDVEEINEKLSRIAGFDEKIQDIDVKIEDLRNSYKRISEITDREKEIVEEFSALEKENRKLFLPIGKAAFEEWKNNPIDELNKVMSGLEESEAALRELENQIYQIQNNESGKSVVNKVKNKGRIILLNSRKRKSLLSMDHLYKRVGEKLYKKEIAYFENMKNEAVGAFILNRKKLDTLTSEKEVLKEESSALEKHLKSSFSSGKQQKEDARLHSDKEFIISGKMESLDELGSFLYRDKFHFNDKEILTFFESADKIHAKNDHLRSEIEKCKAELDIQKLEEEIHDMKNNVKELEMTIEKCANDIGEFNKEIKRAKAEIRKLKKVAETGPQETEE